MSGDWQLYAGCAVLMLICLPLAIVAVMAALDPTLPEVVEDDPETRLRRALSR